MLPRWFRAVVALEVAGAAVVAVLGLRLLASGPAAAGAVVDWGRAHAGALSQLGQAGAPTPAPSAPLAPARPRGIMPTPAGASGIAGVIDGQTRAEVLGMLGVVRQLEEGLCTRLEALLGGPGRAGSGCRGRGP